jgi:alcohol dehydrogenase class IV
MSAIFQASTLLHFGPGAVSKIAEVVPMLKANKLLFITDGGLVRCGVATRVLNVLSEVGVEGVVFDEVEPNPSIQTVERAHTRYRDAACAGIVVVGGGSPIDVAKGVGVLATNPGPLSSYVGKGKVSTPLPPLLAVPTTAGTGSEVTMYAVITDRAQRKKVVIGSPLLVPGYAFLDPELVLTLPANLIAATGMDALTHAIESVISTFANPFSDAMALEAIRLIVTHLPTAVKSPGIDVLGNLLYASTMAGMAFSYARTGLVHGMAHPLSSYYDVPHGLANALLLPHVLAFNLPTCQGRLACVAAAMGEAETAQAAVDAVRRLNAQVDIPDRLSQLGVTETYIQPMAKDAFESGNAQVVNPRQPSLTEVIELYRQAL